MPNTSNNTRGGQDNNRNDQAKKAQSAKGSEDNQKSASGQQGNDKNKDQSKKH